MLCVVASDFDSSVCLMCFGAFDGSNGVAKSVDSHGLLLYFLAGRRTVIEYLDSTFKPRGRMDGFSSRNFFIFP